MKNIQYKGSASRKAPSFKTLPNTWRQHLYASERTIRGMQDVQRATLHNREQQLGSLKENAIKEESWSKQVENFRRSSADVFKEHITRDYKTQLDSIKSQYLDDKAREDLIDLIPKAAEAWSKIDDQLMERATQKMLSLSSYFQTYEAKGERARAESNLALIHIYEPQRLLSIS